MVAQDVSVLSPGGLLIGDQLLPDGEGGLVEHVNPATGKGQAYFATAGVSDVDRAVVAAREGFRAWRALPAVGRRELLTRLIELVAAHREDFTTVAALESGMPVNTSGGMDLALEWMRYYTGWVDKVEGQVVPLPVGGLDYVLPEPYGVVAVIIPWNSPLVATSMTVFPALAAGNSVVLKPPELSPFAAIRFGQLALEAGLPPGTLNVIAGGPVAGEALVRHPGVDKVSFTGGGATAAKVMAAAAATTKPLMLELGGKSANIIFPDADLDAAVPMAAQLSLVVNAGQGCCLPTRLLVHDQVYEDVVERLVAMAGIFTLGDPLDPRTVVGPVISAAACERILGVSRRAVEEKQGRLLTGGERAGGTLAEGFFIQPTIFGEVDQRSSLAQEEIFGPVLAVSRFSSDAEAVELANGTRYGLMAYLHTRDLARAHQVAGGLEAGNVSVNGFYWMAPNAPFGGVKQSGFGRTGGKAGLDEFLRPKNVFIHLPGSL